MTGTPQYDLSAGILACVAFEVSSYLLLLLPLPLLLPSHRAAYQKPNHNQRDSGRRNIGIETEGSEQICEARHNHQPRAYQPKQNQADPYTQRVGPIPSDRFRF